MRTWIVATLLVLVGCDKKPDGDGGGGGVELGKIGGAQAKDKDEDKDTKDEDADEEDAPSGANPFDAFGQAQRKTACVEAQMLLNATEMFQVAERRAPKDIAELQAKGMIARAPDDPWGNAYTIDAEGPKVTSAGPDEKMGTTDDIVVVAGEPDPC